MVLDFIERRQDTSYLLYDLFKVVLQDRNNLDNAYTMVSMYIANGRPLDLPKEKSNVSGEDFKTINRCG